MGKLVLFVDREGHGQRRVRNGTLMHLALKLRAFIATCATLPLLTRKVVKPRQSLAHFGFSTPLQKIVISNPAVPTLQHLKQPKMAKTAKKW
jgi:hypothetical protein